MVRLHPRSPSQHACFAFSLGQGSNLCQPVGVLWGAVCDVKSQMQDAASADLLTIRGGGILTSGCGDSNMYLWDISCASDQPMALLKGHTDISQPSSKVGLQGAGTRQRACEMLQHRMCWQC